MSRAATLRELLAAASQDESHLRESRKRLTDYLGFLRKDLGLTQHQVAGEIGLHYSQVSNIEAGNNWKASTIDRFVAFYLGKIGPPDRPQAESASRTEEVSVAVDNTTVSHPGDLSSDSASPCHTALPFVHVPSLVVAASSHRRPEPLAMTTASSVTPLSGTSIESATSASAANFEQFREEWLKDVLADNPSTTDKGRRFAQKLVTQWKDEDEGTDDLVFCDGAGDGGIDVALLQRAEPPEGDGDIAEGDTWYLVQSKYGAAFQGTGTLLTEGQKVITTLVGERPRLSSLADDLLQRLVQFRANAGELDRIILVYATERPLSPTEQQTLADVRAIGRERLGTMFDVEALSIKTIYDRVVAEETTDDRLRLSITADVALSGEDLLVGSVSLIDLYDFLKGYRSETGDLDQLYEKNVRRFLGSGKRVNKGMQQTLREEPERFGLYNNGITIVVADFERPSADQVVLIDPYVVNGCQTTRTIWEVFHQRLDSGGTKPSAELESWKGRARSGVVVAKIVKVGDGGETLLHDITRCTNSQNAVSSKDFLALDNDFRSWARRMELDYGIFLEIQRGGWDSRRALQRQKPSLRQFKEAANAFELLKVYAAGWLGEAGMAFSKNAPFLPGGAVFRRVTEGGSTFGTQDLYAAYLLQRAADEFKFGRVATLNSRRQTRFLFYYVVLDLLKNVLVQGMLPHTPSDLTAALLAALKPENSTARQQLLDTAIQVVDEYMTQGNDDSVFLEPLFQARFNFDLNAFLKFDDLGRSEEATPMLRSLLSGHKKVMSKAVKGEASTRQVLLDAVKSA